MSVSAPDRNAVLQLKSVSTKKSWKGLPAPVLQITLSRKPWRDSQLLALRYSGFTALLSIPLADNGNRLGEAKIKHLYDFSLGLDPKDGLVDFCFDPLLGQRFAAITQAGKWAIFDLKPKAVGYHCHLLTGGNIKEATVDSATESERRRENDDGWKRIAWVVDQSFLLISTRTKLRIQHATKRQFEEILLATPDKKPWWVLDIETFQRPNYPSLVFILTNMKLFVIQVAREEPVGAVGQPGFDINVEIKLSIAHGRDPLDLSGKVKVIDAGKGVSVFSLKACPN